MPGLVSLFMIGTVGNPIAVVIGTRSYAVCTVVMRGLLDYQRRSVQMQRIIMSFVDDVHLLETVASPRRSRDGKLDSNKGCRYNTVLLSGQNLGPAEIRLA